MNGKLRPKKSTVAFPSTSSSSGGIGMDKNYQAEDDHRTLMRAAEVTGDPSRMTGVRKHQRKVSRGLASVGKMISGGR